MLNDFEWEKRIYWQSTTISGASINIKNLLDLKPSFIGSDNETAIDTTNISSSNIEIRKIKRLER